MKAKQHQQRDSSTSRNSTKELTEKQKDALRRQRQTLKKQAGVEANTAVKKYIKKLQNTLLQPSRKHYGGLGYAKESVFLPLDDPKYGDKFQTIWDEHVPGFSGKSFKKRKSETDDGMLWRQRLKERVGGHQPKDVEALIATLPSKKRSRQSAQPADREKLALGKARNLRATVPAVLPAKCETVAARKRTQSAVAVGDASALQSQAIAAYRKLKAVKAQSRP